MTDPLDPDALDQLLCFNVYSLHRAFSRFYQSAFSQTGLTYAKFVILKALKETGPMSVSALSQEAAVEPNTLSPLLKKMAGFDLVTRQRSAEDERRVDIAITQKGEVVLDRANAVILEGFRELGLDNEQVMGAIGFLARTRRRVEETQPPKLDLDGV